MQVCLRLKNKLASLHDLPLLNLATWYKILTFMFKEAYTCISGRAENAYLVDYWGEGFCTCRKIAHVERLLFEIEKNER